MCHAWRMAWRRPVGASVVSGATSVLLRCRLVKNGGMTPLALPKLLDSEGDALGSGSASLPAEAGDVPSKAGIENAGTAPSSDRGGGVIFEDEAASSSCVVDTVSYTHLTLPTNREV